MIDSPPHEPVAIPEIERVASPAPAPERAPAAAPSAPAASGRAPALAQAPAPPPPMPAPVPVTPPAPAPPVVTTIVVAQEPTPDEKEFAALLPDLQRYSAMSPDELRREQQTLMQALGRSRSDAARVRLAVLYTHSRQTIQDDLRALQLFESVIKGTSVPAPLRQLAAVLSAQVAERVRAVRDEQARSEEAIQKLEALRAMERSLLRDRVRSGGGGSGAGSGGSN